MDEQKKTVTKKDILECVNFIFDIKNGPAVDFKTKKDTLYFYNASGELVGISPVSKFFS